MKETNIDRSSFASLPVVLTVEELAAFLAVSLNTAYELVRQKKVVSVRVGRQYRIPRKALAQYLGISEE